MFKKISNVKKVFWVLVVLCLTGISVSGYCETAKTPTQEITVSGTINVNKDPNENGYIPLGRYTLVSEAYAGKNGLTLFDSRSYTEFLLDGGQAWDIGNGFYIIPGIRDSKGDHWDVNNDYKSEAGGKLLLAIVTDKNGTPFTGSFSTGKVELGGVISSTDCKNTICADYYINLTFNVSNSSCLITTPHDAVFNWPGISPSEIRNGSVAVQTAPVTMTCTNSGEEGVIARPVAITFTSSNGSEDAANGIIKTDKENLGLQLTWHSNGQPIPQDKVIEFPALASATEDFSVDAKPVAINGTQQITGGSFATTVTMSVEYR